MACDQIQPTADRALCTGTVACLDGINTYIFVYSRVRLLQMWSIVFLFDLNPLSSSYSSSSDVPLILGCVYSSIPAVVSME